MPLATKRWMTSDDLPVKVERLKEEIRMQTEHSLESGPEEFSWIMGPIRENVESTIKIMFKGVCSNIHIAEHADNSFVTIENIKLDKLPDRKKLKNYEG